MSYDPFGVTFFRGVLTAESFMENVSVSIPEGSPITKADLLDEID